MGEGNNKNDNDNEDNNTENWKEKTAEGFKVRRNWVHGEYADSKLHGHIASVYDIQFYDDTLVSCSADGLVKGMLNPLPHSTCTTALTSSLSSLWVPPFLVWDMRSCECLVSVDKHNTAVSTVSWQNSCVVSGSPCDGAIHIWDLQTIKRNTTKEDEPPRPEEAADSLEEYTATKEPYVRDYDLYLFHCSVLNHPGVYCAELLPNENGITKLVRSPNQSCLNPY